MKLKGMDKFREKLPGYAGRRIYLLPLRAFVVGTIGYLFMIGLDILPRLMPGVLILVILEPLMPIVGSAFVAVLALWLVGRLWKHKDDAREKYGNLAYQKMLPTGFSGIILIFALLVHTATSVRSLPPVPPVNDLTILWSQSILPMLGVPTEIDVIIRIVLSLSILILGLLTVRAALLTFGFDYITVVYLFFPEESEIQESEIYSVIRHPTYLGAILFGVAAFLFRFSVYSFILCCIVFLIFKFQIRREENELIERFGDSFREYMERTTELFVSPRQWPVYFRFLKGPQES